MPEITREDVAHLARLAHIDMTGEELDRMTGELSVIVDPAMPTVVTGQFLSFAAEVQGVFYSANIDWSVLESGGGGITRSGVYLAPQTEGTWHVVIPAGPHDVRYTDFLGLPLELLPG